MKCRCYCIACLCMAEWYCHPLCFGWCWFAVPLMCVQLTLICQFTEKWNSVKPGTEVNYVVDQENDNAWKLHISVTDTFLTKTYRNQIGFFLPTASLVATELHLHALHVCLAAESWSGCCNETVCCWCTGWRGAVEGCVGRIGRTQPKRLWSTHFFLPSRSGMHFSVVVCWLHRVLQCLVDDYVKSDVLIVKRCSSLLAWAITC